MAEFLLELLSEEIPARMQAGAARDLERLIGDALKKAELDVSSLRSFGGPRRLTLVAEGLPARQADRVEERKGPRANAPEAAIEGFLRSTGLARTDLVERDGVLFANIARPGRPTAELLAEAVEAAVRAFPWPKSMTWGSGKLRWVRPLKSILCVFGGDIVPLTIDGIAAGDRSEGHRVMGDSRSFTARTFADYQRELAAHYVVLSADDRKARIRAGAKAVCDGQGLELVEDEALLDEVAGLAEWPVPILGRMDPSFLTLPPEVIRTSMAVHQRYFAVRAAGGGALAPNFVVVANIEATDGGKLVAAGNARVLSARLSDAKFFWNEDLAAGFEPWLKKLEGVTFHARLGTMAQRVERIAYISQYLAGLLGADRASVSRAASISKADLSSGMVGEFPELQGIMGGYYAKQLSESSSVALALSEQYRPVGPNDECPSSDVGSVIALADKIDLLSGFWLIEEKPTGSRDPYALRRAALGMIRIISENDYRLPLSTLFRISVEKIAEQRDVAIADGILPAFNRQLVEADPEDYAKKFYELVNTHSVGTQSGEGLSAEKISFDIVSFLIERLRVVLRDRGSRHDLLDAIFAVRDDDIGRILSKISAMADFLGKQDGQALLAGYKRANNILRSEERNGRTYIPNVNRGIEELPEERDLWLAWERVNNSITPILNEEAYEDAMGLFAELREPVDNFFERVLVNSENENERTYRMGLLVQVRNLMNKFADFSLVTG